MALFLAVLTFSVIVVVFAAALLLGGGKPREEVIRRRLEAIEKSQKRGQVSADMELLRDELLSDVPWMHRLLMSWSGAHRLRVFLTQAGLKMRPAKLILLTVALALGAFVVALLFHMGAVLAVLMGLGGGFAPTAAVAFLRARRLKLFEAHFPEAIDLLGRALRAGHAFTTGMEMVGKELPEPVAGEFRAVFEEQNFGLPLRDAMLNLAERVPIIDVRFFVTALLVQKETGGNLAEILDNLAKVVRERFRIQGEVRIRTAQGRLTAIILISLPPLMVVLLRVMNPAYINLLFTDPWGPYFLGVAAVLQVIGSILLWKIVQIEV
jgi:tight adherence protein B